MTAPENRLKARLRDGDVTHGLWLGLAHPTVAEMAGRAGVDWCMIDAEHGPNDLPLIQAQLQALAGTGAEAAVRVPSADPIWIKRVLDAGAETVLVPMIESGDQAAVMVAATRYPPDGIRGVGAIVGRASQWGLETGYDQSANARTSLWVQVESAAGVAAIDDIAGTEGVDCVFIGPADLAADMGHHGDPVQPDVSEAISHVITRTRAAGKAAGIITLDPSTATGWTAKGANVIAFGIDSVMLARAMRDAVDVAKSS